jgi:hypothetical protein
LIAEVLGRSSHACHQGDRNEPRCCG